MASASTSSATLRVLENGALNTGTPRAWAASRSTWFVPMQKHPTPATRLDCSKNRAVSSVPERMPTKYASAAAASSSDPGNALGYCSMRV